MLLAARQRLEAWSQHQLSAWTVLLLCGASVALAGVGRATPLAAVARPPRGAAHNAPPTRCACAAPSQPTAQQPFPMANAVPAALSRPAVLLFGDSLTARSLDPDRGWGAALAHYYARKADVINRGFGGYNTRWARPVLEQVLAQVSSSGQPVLLATLWLGANDAALPDRSAARQGVPLEEYQRNLEAMARSMLAAGIPRLVIITPPPVDDAARSRYQQERDGAAAPPAPDRTNAAAARYAAAAAAAGAALGLPVLDLHTALQRLPKWKETLFTDGLHFSGAGQAAVGRLLIGLIEETYPELSLEALPNHFPWWDELADAGPGGEGAVWGAFFGRAAAGEAEGAAAGNAGEEGENGGGSDGG